MTGDAIERALEELRTRAQGVDGVPDAHVSAAISKAYAELARMRATADEYARQWANMPRTEARTRKVPLAVLADMRAHDFDSLPFTDAA